MYETSQQVRENFLQEIGAGFFGEYLISQNLIDRPTLDEGLEAQRKLKSHLKIGELLVKRGALTSTQLMAALKFDRLLETVFRRGEEMLLVHGSPPPLRTGPDMRALQRPALGAQDIELLMNEVRAMGAPQEADGYAYLDFSYGQACRFRVAMFTAVQPTVMLLIKLPAA